jgi:hypothetical protein
MKTEFPCFVRASENYTHAGFGFAPTITNLGLSKRLTERKMYLNQDEILFPFIHNNLYMIKRREQKQGTIRLFRLIINN